MKLSFAAVSVSAVALISLLLPAELPAQAFSSTLQPYPSTVTPGLTVAQIVARISNPAYHPTAAESTVRNQIIQLYLNANMDPSYDYQDDESAALLALTPTGGAPGKINLTDLALSFSPDAPYYHAISTSAAKVALPPGYITSVQVNSAYESGSNGDGIGYGEVTAKSTDPELTVTSEWYTDKSTLVTFPFRMPTNWNTYLPTLVAGDSHMIFTDPAAGSTGEFVSSYKTTLNKHTKGPQALYAAPPTSIIGMGDRGGSTAAKFAELPVMIQQGEMVNATHPIAHAIGGPVGRVWGGRVYPAYARDGGMLNSVNTCTGTGQMDTGLVPYGGVIQLDPAINLAAMKLSLPALRILQAMQTYGFYVMDFGCGDLDIYTADNESELAPYGGMYGSSKGSGVQNEVQKVIAASTLYVVAPMVKH